VLLRLAFALRCSGCCPAASVVRVAALRSSLQIAKSALQLRRLAAFHRRAPLERVGVSGDECLDCRLIAA